jgi:cystathionine gamma-synthase
VVDLERLIAAAHRHGALAVVGNTFATPIHQRPLALGADLVVESATTFLSGRADALGGVVSGRAELVRAIFHFREITGAALHPEAADLILRWPKTLHLRVRQPNENALAIARFLAGHPAVAAVHDPGLASHPGHAVARRPMRGFGGVLAFTLTGGRPAVRRFLHALRLAHLAANLGAVATGTGPPRTTSHVELGEAERAALGIPEALVRSSVGVEDLPDRLPDLAAALAAAMDA